MLVEEAAKSAGVGSSCDAIGLNRSGFYRLRSRLNESSAFVLARLDESRATHSGEQNTVSSLAIRLAAAARKPRCDEKSGGLSREISSHRPAHSLTPAQVERTLSALNSERFLDCSPRQAWATLLDEGTYLCSWRTMYRLLHRNQAVKERRRVRRHPKYVRPELSACGPNQVWTWDITYLKGPIRSQFYYLYVVMDLFSRLVVGWMVADRECAELAGRLMEKSYRKQGVQPGKLTVHADRGAPMRSKSLGQLLSDLDVRKSHSRPRVSNDNPFSEAGFKTMKYSPDFPARFGSLESAEAFCRGYFTWYNQDHHHTGIALLTPAQVHYGEAEAVLARRQTTLDATFALSPQRFRRGQPIVARPPATVWINRPAQDVCDSPI